MSVSVISYFVLLSMSSGISKLRTQSFCLLAWADLKKKNYPVSPRDAQEMFMSIVFLRLSSVAKSSSLQRKFSNCLLVALLGLTILLRLSSSFVSCILTLFSQDLSLLSLSCCVVLNELKPSYIVSSGSIFTQPGP